MKTLDEALDTISDKRGTQAVSDTYARYRSLVEEVIDNPRYQGILASLTGQIITQVAACEDDEAGNEWAVKITFDKLTYALVTGMVIGIEMEKSE